MSHHTADRPLLIEMIRAEAQEYTARVKKSGRQSFVPDPQPGRHLFDIYTANQWMELERNTPMPKMLFGEFWYEGELCILFADTNAGKSVLAVQIGNSLARREPIGDFGVEVDGVNVLYMDFEMSGKQFMARYSQHGLAYQFDKAFFRAGYNHNADMPLEYRSYDEYMNGALEYAITRTGADVLIIDNITCLRGGTERAAEALPLMKHLKALKQKHQLSILVLAHTPKRNPAKPLSRNDLQGSKMLINFADSAFAIGESYKDKNLRYLKQIKQRSTTQVYGPDNVCLCRITKPLNFIKYDFIGHDREANHLRSFTRQEREAQYSRITRLAAQGLSQRQISKQLGVGLAMVNKVVNIEKE